MTKNNILIVENTDVGRIYKETIEGTLNVDVFWAKNENEAINIIENNYIKVALLDQRLDAGELGTEVLKKLRKIQKNVIPIMLTGKAHQDEIGNAMSMGYFKYVDKKNIENLPEDIMRAIEVHNLNLLDSLRDGKQQLIFKFYKGFNLFNKYKVYLISQSLLDKEFIFEDKWVEKLSVEAGKTIENEIEFELENEIVIGDKSVAELITKYSININGLKNSLKNEMSGSIKQEIMTQKINRQKKTTKLKMELTLPPIPQDVNQDYLASKSFQVNQVYYKYSNVIEVVCPECKTPERHSLISYIPISKISKRQVDVLKSGQKEIIEIGIVGI